MPAEKIAFILGGGSLALAAVNHCVNEGNDVFVIALIDQVTREELASIPDIPSSHILWTHPEKTGTILKFLKSSHASKAVMIGKVKRPKVTSLRPDFKALAILLKNLGAFSHKGDDALLKVLKAEFIKRGITLTGIHSVWPQIVSPEQLVIGKENAIPKSIIKIGWNASKNLGKEDKGQSICIFEDGQIFYEDTKGTDALIHRAGMSAGKGGILVKTSKPQQDLDLDMPTIGPSTIKALAENGFKACIIEAHKTILFEREEVKSLCEAHGLTLLSYTDDGVNALS